MLMAKLLLLLLLVIAAALAWRLAVRQAQRKKSPPTPPPQRIVRCAECDVYLPENEAVAADGRYFCSDAHHAAFARRGSGSD